MVLPWRPAAAARRLAPAAAGRGIAAAAGNGKRKRKVGRTEIGPAARLTVAVAAAQEIPQHAAVDRPLQHAPENVGEVAVIAEGGVGMVVAGAAETVAHVLHL